MLDEAPIQYLSWHHTCWLRFVSVGSYGVGDSLGHVQARHIPLLMSHKHPLVHSTAAPTARNVWCGQPPRIPEK